MSDIPRGLVARVDAFMEDINSRDARRLARWMTEETTFWVTPRAPLKGGRRILALMRAIFGMYGEMTWTVRHVYELGPSRVLYFHETVGTLAKNDEPYTNQVVTLIDFDEEGRIAYLSDYFKSTTSFAPPESLAPPIHPEPPPRS